MPDTFPAAIVESVAELEALYGDPSEAAIVKEVARITPHYRAYIEASPFVTLATSGPEGLDCSPRGDPAGFVRVHDEKTLMIPDRRGNNRIDSLRNLIRDPRISLLFLIPGCSETIRVNGRAQICTDPELCRSFEMQGKSPCCSDRCRCGISRASVANASSRSGSASTESIEDSRSRSSPSTCLRICFTSVPSLGAPGRLPP